MVYRTATGARLAGQLKIVASNESETEAVTADTNTAERLGSLLCCLPDVPMPEGSGYENVFRVTIVEFLDRFNFCLGNVKRSCVHFVTPQGQIIPFDTYNTYYRPGAEGGGVLARAQRGERL